MSLNPIIVDPTKIDGRLLLTGATGLLGRYLLQRLTHDWAIVPVGRRHTLAGGESVDLGDAAACTVMLDRVQPSIIVHAAALTDVDACEQAPAHAWANNVEATRHLVAWAASRGDPVRFVYVSTDQIYDAPGPSTEEQARPCNVYSLTKLWAEDLVRTLPRSLVLRVNFLGIGISGRKSLVDWMIESLQLGKPVTFFRDALFNPLYAADLAELLATAIKQALSGTFNCGAGDQGLSKSDVGLHLANALGLSTSKVTIGDLADANLRAARSRDTRMACDRLSSALKIVLPDSKTTLARLVAELRNVQAHTQPNLNRAR